MNLFQMFLDIRGRPDHQKAGQLILRSLWNMLYHVPRRALETGIRRKKYIHIFVMSIHELLEMAKGIGFLRAQLRYLLKSITFAR